MKRIDLYHGSSSILKMPIFGYDNKHNEYGTGFYCTKYKELAKEWSSTQSYNGYSNHYEIDIDGLNILNLQNENYSLLNYLALIVNNRIFSKNTPLMKLASDWLVNNYLVDIKDQDIIIGYRCDDSYFSFVRAFLRNEISLEQLSHALSLEDFGTQIVLKSKKAFDRIEFIDYELTDKEQYYKNRCDRDLNARKLVFEDNAPKSLEGLFIIDLLKQDNENA